MNLAKAFLSIFKKSLYRPIDNSALIDNFLAIIGLSFTQKSDFKVPKVPWESFFKSILTENESG